jgi:Ca2+-transporting ATPase
MKQETEAVVPEGLGSAEAARRLARDGPNILPDAGGRRWGRIARDAAGEPMYLLLVGAATVYLLLGEPLEGAFLFGMVLLMLCLTLYQEGRTERALKALRDLGAPSALVWRDGRMQRLPASELVEGDLVELGEGDRVPADGLLLAASGLLADESLLTGESVPVGKLAAPQGAPAAAPGGADLPWVFSGTLVVQGHGLARVSATGVRSEIGRIGAALGHIVPPRGRLQRETATLARRFAVLGGIVSVLLVALLIVRGSAPLQALLAGIALSMSMLPEEFPVILTVFPAIGAWRLARSQVLTRRLAAIEILGSTSVLCVDKTGTLTENRMAVARLWRDGAVHEGVGDAVLAPAQRELLACALRASRPPGSDPMEAAFWRLAGTALGDGGAVPAGWRMLHEYGLTPQRPALVHVWERGDGRIVVALKGAPETVAAMCRRAHGGPALEAALEAAARMAADGLRVLAVARASLPVAAAAWPEDPAELEPELLGLVALADPLRPDIPAAVAACRAAGLRVVMITGDHPETARAIARQAGLGAADGSPEGVLGGKEIDELDDAALARRLAGVAVCARIAPQQKLRLVQALQRGGAVVAMTGDGVNDAPALRAADVGVAMGLRGTDVAREAAELTLLDDRFASLVEAIAAGRRIFANMRKSMCYVMAMHVPIAGMALLPVLLGWPVMLYPLHIVFLELVIDPACSLAFENEPPEPDLMRRPPRAPAEALFGRAAFASALLQGGWVLALAVALYGWALSWLPEPQARATAFAGLVLCNLALLLSNRQRDGIKRTLRAANPVFWAIAAGAVALLGLAVYVPAAASLLMLAPPPPIALAAAVAVPLLGLAALELRKWLAARTALRRA